MKIDDMSFKVEYIFWIALPEETKMHAGAAKMDIGQSLLSGEYILRQGTNIESVRLLPQSQSIASKLDMQFELGLAHYEVLAAEPQNGVAEMRTVFFHKPPQLVNEFSVIIPKEKKKDFKLLDSNEFMLPAAITGELPYFICAEEKIKKNNQENRSSFVLYAKEVFLEIDLVEVMGMKYVQVHDMKSNRRNQVAHTATLFQGKLHFLDEEQSRNQESSMSAVIFQQLTEAGDIAGDYIKHWNKYGDIEGDVLLKKVRRIGALSFKSCEPVSNGGEFMRFYLEDSSISILSEPLSSSDSFQLVESHNLPIYLKEEITWADFVSQYASLSKNESYAFERIEDNPKSIILKCNRIYGNQYRLIYDIFGDRTRIERQMKARRRIAKGDAGIFHLNLLLEGNTGELPRFIHRRRLKALTPFVQNKVFNVMPPTEMQARAIDIALNTPDIALIQGPPGTGKTTVIAAIIERINEEFDKTQDVKGQILVSAFQHDAVENLMEKLSVNALPMYKFGKRRSDEEEGRSDDVNRGMDDWIQSLSQRLQEKYPDLVVSKKFRYAETCYSKYLTGSYLYRAKELIRALTAFSHSLPRTLEKELSDMRQKYDMVQNGSEISWDKDKIGVIRSLRVTDETAADDGIKRASEFLAAFKGELEADEESLLYTFLQARNVAPEIYKCMESLKRKYLLKYLPMPEYHQPKLDTALDELYLKIREAVQETAVYTDKKHEIISRLLYALEYDPIGARDSILECTPVYPATIQQSEGKEIFAAKGVRGKDVHPEFDTVIVDEAARSSPMDLMIPMANAQRRIILVGDHNQLPHILEDEICRLMEAGVERDPLLNVDLRTDLKKSLFEHLFNALQEQEKHDGIQRTVTLDRQFRMHPLIGDFISRSFYNGSVLSPRKENEFYQTLPRLDGKPVAWLDVPHQAGNEDKRGSSRIRTAEAQAAANLLANWLHDPSGKGMSFGVISFYRAQKKEIYRALSDYGIAEENGGQWNLKEEYRIIESDGKRKERLRIGTVDAFQGMEFDVVLLLMVRTRALPLPKMEKERDYDRIFGHLRSKNRLCVSMSRGKKVLVVVGNKSLAQSEAARNVDLGIPELSAFADLCETSGKIIG